MTIRTFLVITPCQTLECCLKAQALAISHAIGSVLPCHTARWLSSSLGSEDRKKTDWLHPEQAPCQGTLNCLTIVIDGAQMQLKSSPLSRTKSETLGTVKSAILDTCVRVEHVCTTAMSWRHVSGVWRG